MENKVKITAKNQKFCSLCSRVIRRGEECYTFSHEDNRGKTHFGMFNIHLNCSDKTDAMHNLFFRENVKKRSGKTPAQKRGRGGEKAPRLAKINDRENKR